MRRLITLLSAIILCQLSQAQDVVSEFRSKLDGNRVSMNYSFNASGDVPVNGSGTIVIQGNCYALKGNGIEVFCDGATRWTVDPAAKEVYIEKAGGTEKFTGNPREYLDNLSGLKSDGKVITGSYNPKDGSKVNFKISGISCSPLSDNLSDFKFRVSGLGGGWVVTDLR